MILLVAGGRDYADTPESALASLCAGPGGSERSRRRSSS